MLVKKNKMSEQGFSLIELMMVVGIIGILAGVAVPQFQKFQAKARMSEAKSILSHIFTLEEAYFLENNRYVAVGAMGKLKATTAATAADCTNAAAVQLGFAFNPCNATTPRYEYIITAAAPTSGFIASAESGAGANNVVCPGAAAVTHSFYMDQSRDLRFLIGAGGGAWPAAGVSPSC